jgi:hypothetical protein
VQPPHTTKTQNAMSFFSELFSSFVTANCEPACALRRGRKVLRRGSGLNGCNDPDPVTSRPHPPAYCKAVAS